MRNLLLGAVLVASSATASADGKAIEKIVKKNVVELATLADDDALEFTKDAIVVDSRGQLIALHPTEEDQGCVEGAVANTFYGCAQASIKHKPGAVTSGVAGDIGWFQSPFTASIEPDDPDGKSKPEKLAMRIGGIAMKTGSTWKIVAATYVAPIPDKALLAGTGGEMPKGISYRGNKKVGAVVAGWFKTGFAGAAARSGTLLASGTAPAEYKTGAAALGLAKGWDKLKLAPELVDTTVLAGGKVAYAVIRVMLPRKNGKGAVEMRLSIVLVPDGADWKWVSLMYQPAAGG